MYTDDWGARPGLLADADVRVGGWGRAVDLLNTVRPTDAPHAPAHRPGLLRVLGAVLLLLASATDLLVLADPDKRPWPQLVVLPVGLVAVLWRPPSPRPAWLSTAMRAAVPAVLSGVVTAAVWLTGQGAVYGFGELANLLCLLVIAVRTAACGERAAPCGRSGVSP
jgi:hypothetical protein